MCIRDRLDDIAVLHNQDQIRVLDGGKPVGNDETGPASHQVIHSLLNPGFGSGIYGTGGLIQDQYLIVRQYGAGNG